MTSIIAFRQPLRVQNWTNDELAELFRVVDILGRAGVQIDTDMGLTDEGEPWFAFCRADTGDVIVHFARIGGQFVAVSAATDAVVRGSNFRRVAEGLVNRQPLILPAPVSGQKLFLHPAVLLTALVATTLAQMKSWEGQEITALDDLADAPVRTISEASFSETLKTAFADALNLVLRGFTGPQDSKNASTDHSTAMGLGLGNLSLASVVAFAISVIQGAQQEEPDSTALVSLPADASDGARQNPADPVIAAPQIAEHNSGTGAGAQDRLADSAEIAVTKAVARDILAPGVMARTGQGESGAAVPDSEGFIRVAQKEPAGGPGATDHTAAGGHVKLLPVAEKAPAPPAAAAQQPPPAPGHEVVADSGPAELGARVVLHHFNFTEISREAIEILFVKVADAPADSGQGLSPGTALQIAGNGRADMFSVADPVRAPLNASDIVFAAGDPVAMARLNLITDFVNSTDNRFSAPASFPQLLKSYWQGDKDLTLVVFDSDDLPLNIFSFTGSVLFVEEGQLGELAMDAGEGALQIDLANGGDINLLGVINLHPGMTG